MSDSKKPLTLSIIIPVYNEENYLGACLRSIARQTVPVKEVIVVDNNSTDASVQIARSFSFVKVVRETKPHQSYAQAKGFEVSSGDIVGRIDADTILPEYWAEKILTYFAVKPRVIAVTGSGVPYDSSIRMLGKYFFERYYHVADKLAGHTMLWGANCAVRKTAWDEVKDKVNLRADIWEDYDLSLCLAPHGQMDFLRGIDVEFSFRSVHKSLWTQMKYQYRAVRTFSLRAGRIKTGFFFLCWTSLFLLYIPVLVDKYVSKAARIKHGFFGWGQTPKIDTTDSSRR